MPTRVLPVVVLHDAEQAVPLCEALVRGGLATIEITLRTPAALEAIRRTAATTGARVGAGSVRSARQAEASLAAGACFLVSPGLDAEVAEVARSAGVPWIPGAVTGTELMAAEALGLSTVKFFPAEQLGGPATLRALSDPFPEMSFVPTGGLTLEAVPAYLELAQVPAVGGSWMVDRDALARGRFDLIEAAARATVELAA